MTIPEKPDFETRTIGLFQRHESTTPLASITSTDKQTKEKENERLNHFSSIMEVSKRPVQIQEAGPMKKKAGGRETFFHSSALDQKVWVVPYSDPRVSLYSSCSPENPQKHERLN